MSNKKAKTQRKYYLWTAKKGSADLKFILNKKNINLNQ